MRPTRLQRAKKNFIAATASAAVAGLSTWGAIEAFDYAEEHSESVLSAEPVPMYDDYQRPITNEFGEQLYDYNHRTTEYTQDGATALWGGKLASGAAGLSGLLTLVFMFRGGHHIGVHRQRERDRKAEIARWQRVPAGRVLQNEHS